MRPPDHLAQHARRRGRLKAVDKPRPCLRREGEQWRDGRRAHQRRPCCPHPSRPTRRRSSRRCGNGARAARDGTAPGLLRFFLQHVSGGFGKRGPDLCRNRSSGGYGGTRGGRPRNTPFLPECRRDPSGRVVLLGARLYGHGGGAVAVTDCGRFAGNRRRPAISSAIWPSPSTSTGFTSAGQGCPCSTERIRQRPSSAASSG